MPELPPSATDTDPPCDDQAADGTDDEPIAKVIPLGVFDPFKEADKRWWPRPDPPTARPRTRDLSRGFRRQVPVAEITVGTMSADTSAAFDGRGLVELGPTATAEQRMDFLMTQVTALQTEVGRLGENLAAESREWHEAFATLGATVSEEAAKTRLKVKDAKADGLAQEAIGLWCVGAGVVLALIGSLMG